MPDEELERARENLRAADAELKKATEDLEKAAASAEE